MNAAAARNTAARHRFSTTPAPTRAKPAKVAKTRLHREIWFGLRPTRASQRADALAQFVSRDVSGRRVVSCTAIFHLCPLWANSVACAASGRNFRQLLRICSRSLEPKNADVQA